MSYWDRNTTIPEYKLNITIQPVVVKPRKLKSIWSLGDVQSKVPKSTGKPWKSRLIKHDQQRKAAADDLRNLFQD